MKRALIVLLLTASLLSCAAGRMVAGKATRGKRLPPKAPTSARIVRELPAYPPPEKSMCIDDRTGETLEECWRWAYPPPVR